MDPCVLAQKIMDREVYTFSLFLLPNFHMHSTEMVFLFREGQFLQVPLARSRVYIVGEYNSTTVQLTAQQYNFTTVEPTSEKLLITAT